MVGDGLASTSDAVAATRDVSASVRGTLDIVDFIGSVDALQQSLEEAEASLVFVEGTLNTAADTLDQAVPVLHETVVALSAIPAEIDAAIADAATARRTCRQSGVAVAAGRRRRVARGDGRAVGRAREQPSGGRAHRGAGIAGAPTGDVSQPKFWRSRSRMRPARVASSLCANAGTSSMTPMKWRWSSSRSVAIGLAHDGGGARTVVEQRELADDGAGAERADLLAVALHGDGAIEHDECLTPRLTLIHDEGARGHGDLVARFRDLLEFLGGAALEQTHVAQVLEVRLLVGHVRHYTSRETFAVTWIDAGLEQR